MSMHRLSATADSPDTVPAGEWVVDPRLSAVVFHTRTMFGLLPVHGSFDRFSGSLRVDEDGTATGTLDLDVASIATGIAKRDAHLRTADFFHADEYPSVAFTLDGLTVGREGRPIVSGVLRVRDKEIPVTTPITIAPGDGLLSLHATFVVDHDAAGLGWAKRGMVRKTVRAEVAVTLKPQPE